MTYENKEQIIIDLEMLFNDIEKRDVDTAMSLCSGIIDRVKSTNLNQPIIEQKDSIKITKNTKGYNYEFKIVAKEGVSMWDQIDYTKGELDKRIKEWEGKK